MCQKINVAFFKVFVVCFVCLSFKKALLTKIIRVKPKGLIRIKS